MFSIIFVVMMSFDAACCNVALRKPISASSIFPDPRISYQAFNVVDGDRDVDVYAGKCFSTDHGDLEPWLLIDLLGNFIIENITIINREDFQSARLHDFRIELFNVNPLHCTSAVGKLCVKFNGEFGTSGSLTCDQEVKGRFLKVSKDILHHQYDTLVMCELEVVATEPSECNSGVVFPRLDGFELSQASPTNSLNLSRLDCAIYCANSKACVGFNYKATTATCQAIVRPSSNDSILNVASSNYYGVDFC